MHPEDEWDMVRKDRRSLPDFGTGALGMALLFGSAAIALALILVPIAESQIAPRFAAPGGVDRTVTGSTAPQRHYTIRRSVLQSSPDAVCIIRADGMRSGSC